ncbi:MAG: hypothetical protein LBJ25_01255 [Candidatus Margulisbacteria bacterium]|jgi:flagellar motor switch protein FliG|nr:hypothetical protein [Candidatus Margulisiibacteriota bacterium]
MVAMQLKGREKALIFLSALGDEVSRKVLDCLPESIALKITRELNNFKKPSPEAVAFVLKELTRFALTQPPEAPKLKEPEPDPLDTASEIGRKPLPELVALLQNELPQTAAFVLSYLSAGRQKDYYEMLSPGRRSEIKQCAVEKLPWSDSLFAILNEQVKARG